MLGAAAGAGAGYGAGRLNKQHCPSIAPKEKCKCKLKNVTFFAAIDFFIFGEWFNAPIGISASDKVYCNFFLITPDGFELDVGTFKINSENAIEFNSTDFYAEVNVSLESQVKLYGTYQIGCTVVTPYLTDSVQINEISILAETTIDDEETVVLANCSGFSSNNNGPATNYQVVLADFAIK